MIKVIDIGQNYLLLIADIYAIPAFALHATPHSFTYISTDCNVNRIAFTSFSSG